MNSADPTLLLRHIQQLNQHKLHHFLPLHINGIAIGWVGREFAATIAQLRSEITIFHDSVSIDLATSFVAISHWFATLNQELVEQGVIRNIMGEEYPIGPQRLAPLGVIDRATVAYYGIRSYGQHINGYLLRDGVTYMWIAKRAANRHHEPGKLDQLVAGGLPYGITLLDNLLKECQEEANIPAELARQAQPTGIISYCKETANGLKPDIMFCYDLLLPEDFAPQNTDGEVEQFSLMPLDEVYDLVCNSDSFKHNCNLVIIDFLIRHGYIDPEEECYSALNQGLRPQLP